jgi:hypothetical protein
MAVVSDIALKFREKVDFPGTVSRPHNNPRLKSVLSCRINSVLVFILKKLLAMVLCTKDRYSYGFIPVPA